MKDFTKRQKEIVETSIQLISEKGMQGLTIKNISKAIGISDAAIYRHFDSKMDILLGILSYFEDNTKSIIEKTILQKEKESLLTQIETIFITHCQEFTEKPSLSTIIFSEEIFQNDKRLSDKIFSIMKIVQENVMNLIEKGQNNNTIRSDIPSKQLTIIIMGTLRLIIKKWRLSNFEFDLIEEGKKLWNSLEKLITKGA